MDPVKIILIVLVIILIAVFVQAMYPKSPRYGVAEIIPNAGGYDFDAAGCTADTSIEDKYYEPDSGTVNLNQLINGSSTRGEYRLADQTPTAVDDPLEQTVDEVLDASNFTMQQRRLTKTARSPGPSTINSFRHISTTRSV
jgi:hypothetical protein